MIEFCIVSYADVRMLRYYDTLRASNYIGKVQYLQPGSIVANRSIFAGTVQIFDLLSRRCPDTQLLGVGVATSEGVALRPGHVRMCTCIAQ